jgi:membrane protein implicated in regulation of membrane protease activity
MTWSDFYLICFAVGFCFSFFSFIFGGSRFGRMHLPHFHGNAVGHLPPAHGPVAHGPASHGPAAQGAAGKVASHGGGVSPFNPPSIAAFLAWFGGTGYLLTRFSAVWVGLALTLSVVSGLIGGAIIFFFLTKVLISDEECLDPADFEMIGVLGKLSVPIREAGGTGELIYSQMGTRRVCGARSESGDAISKGTEVVVTRYEKGIAYVRLWEEMANE